MTTLRTMPRLNKLQHGYSSNQQIVVVSITHKRREEAALSYVTNQVNSSFYQDRSLIYQSGETWMPTAYHQNHPGQKNKSLQRSKSSMQSLRNQRSNNSLSSQIQFSKDIHNQFKSSSRRSSSPLTQSTSIFNTKTHSRWSIKTANIYAKRPGARTSS